MAKQKRKRKPKGKKNTPLSKFFIILLSFLSIAPLLVGLYLYKSEKLQFNFQEDKNRTEIPKQKPIADKDLIQKMQTVLAKKQDELKKNELKKNEPKTQKPPTQKPLIEINQTKDNLLAKKPPLQEKNETKKPLKEKPVFPTISEALTKQKPTEVEDYIQSSKKSPKKVAKKITKKAYKGVPKLAIIIDDVAFGAQVNKIKKIPYKVTSSFLPPTKKHPNTPQLARLFSDYMVHLPLEAYHHAHPEERTLKKGESYKNIHRWIKKIKKDFPKAKYYNNHTGSKFTADLRSMDRLYLALKNENLLFLDSRTTVNTKAKQMAKKYKMPLFSRDVFLDNSYKEEDIKKQLKEAVRVAKLQGLAIAICHPHSTTLKVLREAKPLLKGVKLVHVNEL